MKVFCDNGNCDYISEYGFCGCDKLNIVGGICMGSYRSGRNVCDGDVDERLQAENAKLQDENARLRSCLSDDVENARMIMDENAKLRELVRDMWHEGAFAPGACYVETDRLEERTRELGVEVDA